jgi:hypothetical protein
MARSPISGPAAWHGRDFENDDRWIWHFGKREVAALDMALAHVTQRDIDWPDLSAADFPLGEFADDMSRLADELENGRGVVLLRGLPVERYTAEQLKAIHFGLACHLGTPVYQSTHGEMIGEITDDGVEALTRGTLDVGKDKPFLSSRARVQTNAALRWHTDRTDVVTLLCAEQSKSGGLSQIASAVAIHDAMLERRPDLLDELFRDIPRSRLGEEKGGEAAHYMLPVFAIEDGKFTTHYSRTYIEAGQKVASVPKMSDRQWEALDMLADLGHELGFTHAFERGDIQYLNNHLLYHGRTAYEDGDNGHRLLYRVWISMANSRPLPDSFAVLFGDVAAGQLRGGIRQPDGSNRP